MNQNDRQHIAKELADDVRANGYSLTESLQAAREARLGADIIAPIKAAVRAWE